MIFLTSGIGGLAHSFCTIVGTFCLVKFLGPRYGPWMSFVYVFTYLFFFRTCHWLGLPKPLPHSNAVQLLLTLRMCTIAFEGFQLILHNGYAQLEDMKDSSTWKVSFYDTLCYGYCYCGLMTGPYYRYTTYVDMLNQKIQIPSFHIALQRLQYLPFFIAIFVPVNMYFPAHHLKSDEYLDHPWGCIYQISYLVPLFIWFRIRFYIAWLLAESSCISLALGAYPEQIQCLPGQGPTTPLQEVDQMKKGQAFNFETIRNIKLWETEYAPTLHKTTKTWNMTVQWWLVHYFYKKFPFKKHRAWATFLFSAYWHGVLPGYYLTFMSVPLVILAQSLMHKFVNPSLKWEKVYDWLSWFILHRCFEYLSVAFILLDINDIVKVWSSMYFYIHICTILLIPLLLTFNKIFTAHNHQKM